jgi:hypothetical protein
MASMSLELQSEFGADLFFLSASKHPKGTACAVTDSGLENAEWRGATLPALFVGMGWHGSIEASVRASFCHKLIGSKESSKFLTSTSKERLEVHCSLSKRCACHVPNEKKCTVNRLDWSFIGSSFVIFLLMCHITSVILQLQSHPGAFFTISTSNGSLPFSQRSESCTDDLLLEQTELMTISGSSALIAGSPNMKWTRCFDTEKGSWPQTTIIRTLGCLKRWHPLNPLGQQ